MVRNHSPALWCLVIHVGGNHVRRLRAVGAQHFDPLYQVMHGAGQRIHFVYVFRMRLNGAIREHGFKCGANGASTDKPRPAWVDTHNFFFIGPARHQPFNIALSQGIIESGFHIIRIATQGGCSKFSFAHGVLENKKPGVRRVSENDQRVERHHFIF
jgi:hypothetical protein